MKSIVRCTLFLLIATMLAACGGGSSSSNPPLPVSHGVTVKLATTGTPSAQLAGMDVIVELPTGVVPALNNDGSVAGITASVSGVAAPGTVLPPVYTPASGGTKARLHIDLASAAPAGFGAGEFATLKLVAAPGVLPGKTDFTVVAAIPVDVSGNSATGLTTNVAEVTIP